MRLGNIVINFASRKIELKGSKHENFGSGFRRLLSMCLKYLQNHEYQAQTLKQLFYFIEPHV
jgi:hypothetical protein